MENQQHPDAKSHQIVSFIKSGIRIAGCIVGMAGQYEAGFVIVLVAELVGIYEELV